MVYNSSSPSLNAEIYCTMRTARFKVFPIHTMQDCPVGCFCTPLHFIHIKMFEKIFKYFNEYFK